jgi:hypothetical protein
MEVLERVGKETMEFIVEETGMEVDKGSATEGDQQTEEEPFEEVSFDRCFYIYGGPDQLEVMLCFHNVIVFLFIDLSHFFLSCSLLFYLF